ncbi:MAG TPA: YggT family protein [Candidatus Binataceae bacterium]|nr:YggT family protein [Candidatus Binataceae bacterium]
MPDILVSTIVFAAQTLSGLLQIYFWIVIIAALLSWVQPDPYNPIVRALYGMTEPVFDWIREHLPVYFGGLDLSPIVVLIAIQFVQRVLIVSLLRAITPAAVIYGS